MVASASLNISISLIRLYLFLSLIHIYGALMLNGGHLAGWAVEDPALVEQINTALANLGDAAAFAAR